MNCTALELALPLVLHEVADSYLVVGEMLLSGTEEFRDRLDGVEVVVAREHLRNTRIDGDLVGNPHRKDGDNQDEKGEAAHTMSHQAPAQAAVAEAATQAPLHLQVRFRLALQITAASGETAASAAARQLVIEDEEYREAHEEVEIRSEDAEAHEEAELSQSAEDGGEVSKK